jgi:hypothetical protein
MARLGAIFLCGGDLTIKRLLAKGHRRDAL